MKTGDLFMYKGEVRTLVGIDYLGDIFLFSKKDDIGNWFDTREMEILSKKNSTIDVEMLPEDGRYYYVAEYKPKDYHKITLTKLAKKMYKINDDFTGDFYVLK